ncbi:MAG: tRNA pseudouridine(55) synthase TruB [Gammaproteobacteria bacterium]
MKKKQPAVSGILLLNKSTGLTSNRALYDVKRLYSERKVGHSGSLDPIATGMLVCCLGEATKFCSWLLNADKTYQTRLILGKRTDTGDAEGTVISERPVKVTRDQLEAAVETFRGTIEQIPPMYSAIKYQGQALYKLARQGKTVERQPRTVHITDLKIDTFSAPALDLSISCSKGFYVRSLADDLGELLGCGAHVSQLHRVQVAPFESHQMLQVSELEALSETERLQRLLPADSHLKDMPQLDVMPPVAERLQTGNMVPLRQEVQPGWVRLYCNEQLLGLGEVGPRKNMLIPRKIMKLMGYHAQASTHGQLQSGAASHSG